MPKDVKEWKDLPYKNDGEKAHRMDVFRPKTEREKHFLLSSMYTEADFC